MSNRRDKQILEPNRKKNGESQAFVILGQLKLWVVFFQLGRETGSPLGVLKGRAYCVVSPETTRGALLALIWRQTIYKKIIHSWSQDTDIQHSIVYRKNKWDGLKFKSRRLVGRLTVSYTIECDLQKVRHVETTQVVCSLVWFGFMVSLHTLQLNEILPIAQELIANHRVI